mmetsp:Transcript_32391/g.39213  ORF Transcript_32391/g.39213 Transcript_32391/m.39213 type:complete len:118 (+) Transcript_32391:406-759(+)|eukprot:CAMPEP_0197852994 /NCGR_PEP_ID=MMETSP1438-20131217/21903_1 /TAXON_ID=1461541 /ORGANISM="Pterosperma sp., Strain CCMP1384" /LENGTH=117 /DNA_ID=CAMNT_0043467257 /DNA_START=403 /DNA_END=756 /DNA_ORIENTATION=+
MPIIDPDRFLSELHKLYERNKTSGTVYLTMKRTDMKRKFKSKKKEDEESENHEYVCLVRATDGKRKISATLTPKDFVRFHQGYSTVLKANLDALKKREREKKKKTKPQATTPTTSSK